MITHLSTLLMVISSSWAFLPPLPHAPYFNGLRGGRPTLGSRRRRPTPSPSLLRYQLTSPARPTMGIEKVAFGAIVVVAARKLTTLLFRGRPSGVKHPKKTRDSAVEMARFDEIMERIGNAPSTTMPPFSFSLSIHRMHILPSSSLQRVS